MRPALATALELEELDLEETLDLEELEEALDLEELEELEEREELAEELELEERGVELELELELEGALELEELEELEGADELELDELEDVLGLDEALALLELDESPSKLLPPQATILAEINTSAKARLGKRVKTGMSKLVIKFSRSGKQIYLVTIQHLSSSSPRRRGSSGK